MFSMYSEEVQKVLVLAKKEMSLLKHPYVGSEHLLLAILHNDNLDITKFLNKYNINYSSFKNEVIRVIGKGSISNNWFLFTPLLKRVLENSILECREKNINEVSIDRIFVNLLEEGDGVAIRLLMGMSIDIEFLYDKFSDSFIYKKNGSNKKLLIDEFAVDFNEKSLNGQFDPVIGRDECINRLIEILLRRTKNNPLLIGDAGVGKTAIVEELARRITLKKVPEQLLNKRILSVSCSSLVAGTKYRGEFEERINNIISEIENNTDIILFIDEIHTLVGAGGAEGAIDASNILKPYLARGNIKIIGATTKGEYSKSIEKDKALDRRFQKIIVNEPNSNETYDILINLKDVYERFHNVLISDEIINKIIELSDMYLPNFKQPDKSIDILDEVCCKTSLIDSKKDLEIKKLKNKLDDLVNKKNQYIINHDYKNASVIKNQENVINSKLNKVFINNMSSNNKKEISLNTLYEVISLKTNIPIVKLQSMNYKNIFNNLKKIIFGHDNEIRRILNTIYNRKLFYNKKPISFLITGRTGVGKTMFVKEYAKLLYNDDSFIKLDMSEYKESYSVSKIIGSPPGYVGYDDKNSFLEKVKFNPHSIILLDEIEKANKSVLRLFLQILDDGFINNSCGEKIDFSNTIIFMTSNLGSDSNNIGFIDNKNSIILNKIKEFFDLEFINRLDDIIIFNNISDKDIMKIIKLRLNFYYNKYNIKNVLSTKTVNKIKIESKYSVFGARKIDNLIEKELKNYSYVMK